MSKKFISIFLCLTLIIVMLSACKNKTAKMISCPVERDTACLDPQIAVDDTSKIVINNCFEGLVRLGKGERIIPGVASSWKVSADKRTYIFNLRRDTNWYLQSNLKELLGKDYDKKYRTKVTAQDFVFGITRALDPKTNAIDAHKLFSIKNAKEFNQGKAKRSDLGLNAINDHTLEITLDSPSVNFLHSLTQPVAMPCHKDFFEKTSGKYGKKASLLLCNGPFYLRRWEANTFLTLIKNDNYKGNQDVIPSGVKFNVNPEKSTYLSKLISGSYDVAPILSDDLSKIPEDEPLNTFKFKNSVWALCINNKTKGFDNNNLRLAIKSATNKTLMSQKDKINSQGIIPSSCLLMFGAPYRAQAGTIDYNGYSPQAAQSYWDSYVADTGSSQLSVNLLCLKEHTDIVKKIIQGWQKAFGIEFSVSIMTMEKDELQKRVRDGNFQIAFTKFVADDILAEDFLYEFKSDNYKNFINYESSEFDSILEGIRTSKSQKELLKNCKNAETALLRNANIYPSFFEESYIASSPNVKGLYIYPSGNNISFITASKK